jgi:hypothetical protein
LVDQQREALDPEPTRIAIRDGVPKEVLRAPELGVRIGPDRHLEDVATLSEGRYDRVGRLRRRQTCRPEPWSADSRVSAGASVRASATAGALRTTAGMSGLGARHAI